MIKKYFLLALPSIIIISLFYLFKPSNQEINAKIKALKEENKMLKKANDSIFLSIKGLEKIKEDADHKIVLLEKEEEKQKEKIQEVNNKLTQLKHKYEKANNHSNNFSSDDVQRYFSDSLDFR